MAHAATPDPDLRSREVLEVLRHLDHEREPRRRTRIDLRQVLAEALPGPDGPDLSTAEGRRTLTELVWHPADVASGRPLRSSPVMATAVRVALAIDDVRAGRWHLVPSNRLVSALEGLGLPVADGRPTVLPVPSTSRAGETAPNSCGDDLPVEFAFPWCPNPHGSRRRLGTATDVASVRVIDGGDAPVACSLRSPEGRLEVRHHGGTWLRPVLSPDCWKPVTLCVFRDAAASGVAWRDSPFLPHTGRCRPTFDLSDDASPRVLARGDVLRIARAREACRARAGFLCLVDGIVHRDTEEPLAGMATLVRNGRVEIGPAWTLGSLASTCSMDILECHEGLEAHWSWGDVRLDDGWRPKPHGTFVPLADWVHVADLLPADLRGDGGPPPGWPTADDLVRLGPSHPRTCDGRLALEVVAAVAKDASPPSRGLHASTGLPFALGRLGRLSSALRHEDLRPDERRILLSQLGPTCREVSAALPTSEDVRRALWVYVVALATHVSGLEAEACADDDLASVCL